MAGRFETAVGWAERAIHRMPRWYFAHFVLVASYQALDRQEDGASPLFAPATALAE